MNLEPLFRMRVTLGRRYPIGAAQKGRRNVWTLSGGEFEGPRLRGEVAPVGGEFELIDAAGIYHIDVRLVLVTDDGANIYLQYHGVADTPAEVADRYRRGAPVDFGDSYFVTQPRFETAHPAYSWLSTTMAIAEGRGVPDGVEYLVYACRPDARIGAQGMAAAFAYQDAPHG